MKKIYLFFIILIVFTIIFCFFAFGEEKNLVIVKCLDNKSISLNIWMDKGEAVMYFMGNHMFKMSAKYLPIAGAPPDNLIELKGNGTHKIYLNKRRKIFYFREGNKGIFANLKIYLK